MAQPLVSIVCEVYNHEPYLRECLDGFVMQKTNFPFEIIINDDASTDRSAEILREYEAKYPTLFKPIYQTKNQYSQGVSLWTKVQFPRAQGKYIAICEGDDHWIDPEKLQKQADYLEAHPDCTMCFHNAYKHFYDENKPDVIFSPIVEKDYSFEEIIQPWVAPTASFFFRKTMVPFFEKMEAENPNMMVGDMPLLVVCAQHGVVHAMADIMSVYAVHFGGYTQFHDAKRTFRNGLSWEARRKAFGPEGYKTTTSMMTGQYINSFIRAIKEHNFTILVKSFYRGFIRQPLTCLKALIRIPKERKLRLLKEKN